MEGLLEQIDSHRKKPPENIYAPVDVTNTR